MNLIQLRKASNRQLVIDSLSRFILALPLKDYEIEIREKKRKRSDQQNRYLFGVAYKILSEETGNEVEDLHTYFCLRFFGEQEIEVFGRRKIKPRRTTTRSEDGRRDVLSTTEFMDFVALVQQVAAEQGIYVPDPNEE